MEICTQLGRSLLVVSKDARTCTPTMVVPNNNQPPQAIYLFRLTHISSMDHCWCLLVFINLCIRFDYKKTEPTYNKIKAQLDSIFLVCSQLHISTLTLESENSDMFN